MLQAAAITELLSRLISDDASEAGIVRPHTALLSLVDSSELYAVATKLVEHPPARSAVASILASTAAAAGTPPPSQLSYSRAAPLTLDERAACLSAIAVTAWRQAAEPSTATSNNGVARSDAGVVVMPGASVSVAKHAARMAGLGGGKPGKELVPLLLESDLGRVLVMPIVPAPTASPSRNEHAHDDVHDDSPAFAEHSKPFMLLTLNASCSAAPSIAPKSPATANATSPALTSSVATLSANNATRSRLRSGGTTPTSARSEHTPTPSRSPVSDHFPAGSTTLPSAPAAGDAETAAAAPEADVASEWDAKQWTALYAQAKALARVLAPSLAQSGVAHDHHDDAAGEGRHSTLVSDDEAEA
jgi:hypothetical protein